FAMGDQQIIRFTRPVVYKHVDPAKGEITEPFDILPPVFVTPKTSTMVFSDTLPQSVSVILRAGKDDVSGQLVLDVPENWSVSPDSVNFHLTQKDEEKVFEFEVIPADTVSSDSLFFTALLDNGDSYNRSYIEIDYDHITKQKVLLPALVKLNKLDMTRMGERIGYIMGAGDEVRSEEHTSELQSRE